MAKSAPDTIVIEWPTNTGPKLKEALAGTSIITPGEILAWSSGNLILNSHSGGTAPTQKMVAVESPTVSPSTSDAIATDYASGDTVYYVVPLRGAVLYMWLADGQNVAKGAALEPDGNGHLTAVTSVGTTGVDEGTFGYAHEAVNNSAGGAPARIKVEAA